MTTPAYHTVTAAKVAKFPLTIVKDDGSELLVFVRIGVRVEMADGSWWFQSKKGSGRTTSPTWNVTRSTTACCTWSGRTRTRRTSCGSEWGGEPGFMEALDEAENRDYFDSRTWSWAEISANRTFTCRRVAQRDRMMSEIVQARPRTSKRRCQ